MKCEGGLGALGGLFASVVWANRPTLYVYRLKTNPLDHLNPPLIRFGLCAKCIAGGRAVKKSKPIDALNRAPSHFFTFHN